MARKYWTKTVYVIWPNVYALQENVSTWLENIGLNSTCDMAECLCLQENVSTWLENIGLKQYKANFEREQIRTSKEMEVLKSFGRQEVEKELKITKKGNFVCLI